jgi:hypothetical protein
MEYEQLPNLVRDNLSEDQWAEAQRVIVTDGAPVPETSDYINLKNGQIHAYQIGEPADGPLLAVHDMAGGRGRETDQYRTAPPGAHGTP